MWSDILKHMEKTIRLMQMNFKFISVATFGKNVGKSETKFNTIVELMPSVQKQ